MKVHKKLKFNVNSFSQPIVQCCIREHVGQYPCSQPFKNPACQNFNTKKYIKVEWIQSQTKEPGALRLIKDRERGTASTKFPKLWLIANNMAC